MNRNLIIQMRNEWKENFWICLELIIVSTVVWLLSMLLIENGIGVLYPKGFKVDNVYEATFKSIDNSSPSYVEYPDTTKAGYYRAMANDIRNLINGMRGKPYVEAVAIGDNALPYNYNYYGTGYFDPTLKDTIFYHCNQRTVTPDMPLVLHYQTAEGASYQDMRDILLKGETLISTNEQYERLGGKVTDLKGKELISPYEQGVQLKVGGIINPVRRSDYEVGYGGTIIVPVQESDDYSLLEAASKMAIRVKPGMGSMLENDFRNDPALSRQRNVIIRNLKPLSLTRKTLQWTAEVEMRQLIFAMVCLFFIVFLGILGTFWFRTQQRIGEIAIRKVGGATSRDIFRRFIAEGMILVLISTAIASLIDFMLYWFNIMDFKEWEMKILFVYAGLAVFVMLVIAVLIGIWLPAVKAMRIEPANALKSE